MAVMPSRSVRLVRLVLKRMRSELARSPRPPRPAVESRPALFSIRISPPTEVRLSRPVRSGSLGVKMMVRSPPTVVILLRPERLVRAALLSM